jgi:hypothetical protein
MVPPTRRALLHGAAGLTTALAGCGGLLDGSGESTRTVPPDERDGGPGSGSATDPERLLLRVDTDRSPIWLAESSGGTGGRPTPSRRDRWRDAIIVDESARADRISVAETVDGDRIESFLAATDFDSETVYVEMGAVEECFRLELCQVSWTPTELSTDYTRRSRPYTERCAADGWVIEARLIRIPDAIEADDVNSYSSSIGAGVCDRRRGRAAGEAGSESEAASERPTQTATATVDSGGDR